MVHAWITNFVKTAIFLRLWFGWPLHSNTTCAISCGHYFIEGKPLLGLRPLLWSTVRPQFCLVWLSIGHVVRRIAVRPKWVSTNTLHWCGWCICQARRAVSRGELTFISIQVPFQMLRMSAFKNWDCLIMQVFSTFRHCSGNSPRSWLGPEGVNFNSLGALIKSIDTEGCFIRCGW